MGDFNAGIQRKIGETKSWIGRWTFDRENDKLEGQSEGAADNRQRFIAFTNVLGLKAMNTFSKR